MTMPDRYVWPEPQLRTCQHCRREFYRMSDSGRYCSDDFAGASWSESRAIRNAAMVRARSEERAANRRQAVVTRLHFINNRKSTGIALHDRASHP
jgi:hypothetical protein